ncbi:MULTISPECIES: ribonuclease Z [Kyrpidia]|uniref:ribonuclease Z n=1 Tax=Kyrpidia TaxID=1129704 RepID=UPI001475E613|nr:MULTISPECIES: ribonuclease Z [Kyrpidia]MCL6576205.1 ribonuclease Z [Kyrpidia sp.]
MELYFLGTGAGAPSKERNVSAVGLRQPRTGRWWLFDCGEGTQHRMAESPFKWNRLEAVFITHLHGDHVFGLPGLLASRSLLGLTSPLAIFGPSGLRGYLESVFQFTDTHLGFALEVEEIGDGWARTFACGWTVRCGKLCHSVESLGFRVEEPPQPGRFHPEKALALGVEPGPAYARLKRGETVVLPGGRKVAGRDVTDPPRPGRRVVLLGDTEPCTGALTLAEGADLLVHEATFLSRDEPLARRSRHSTAAEAADLARRAKAGKLVITHLSPRYAGRELELLAEARAVFPATEMAIDGSSFRCDPHP